MPVQFILTCENEKLSSSKGDIYDWKKASSVTLLALDFAGAHHKSCIVVVLVLFRIE